MVTSPHVFPTPIRYKGVGGGRWPAIRTILEICRTANCSNGSVGGSRAGWKQGTERHVAGIEELRRRKSAPADLRSWIALGISLAACLIALAAFLYTVFKG